MRGVTYRSRTDRLVILISTHTPHARRDNNSLALRHSITISTHTPHARRDVPCPLPASFGGLFQLTRLMRGVTVSVITTRVYGLFQLTRLMRGVTVSVDGKYDVVYISTHTPHARRDVVTTRDNSKMYISTHTPHARRDLILPCAGRPYPYFNSHASCEA